MDTFIEPNAEGLPTMREFQGRALVMRLDEAAMERATLVEDLIFMRNAGVRPIVVLDVVQRALSARLVGLINRVGGDAVSLDGTSASTLVVAPDAEGRNVVRSVNASLLSLLLEQGYITVFSAQGTSLSGSAEPLDAVDAARELAAAIRAKRLLFPSRTGGIRTDGEGIIEELTSSEALALAATGTLAPDASKHLEAAALGVRSGVDAAQLLDLSASHAALVELLTAQHLGTQVISHVII
jgi:acetylglutamate kinase